MEDFEYCPEENESERLTGDIFAYLSAGKRPAYDMHEALANTKINARFLRDLFRQLEQKNTYEECYGTGVRPATETPKTQGYPYAPIQGTATSNLPGFLYVSNQGTVAEPMEHDTALSGKTLTEDLDGFLLRSKLVMDKTEKTFAVSPYCPIPIGDFRKMVKTMKELRDYYENEESKMKSVSGVED